MFIYMYIDSSFLNPHCVQYYFYYYYFSSAVFFTGIVLRYSYCFVCI